MSRKKLLHRGEISLHLRTLVVLLCYFITLRYFRIIIILLLFFFLNFGLFFLFLKRQCICEIFDLIFYECINYD